MRRLVCCAALCLAAGALLSLMSGTASAQTPVKEPVIDSAPSRVGLGRGATIVGHLDGWTTGDEVSLQRLRGDRWRHVATRAVNQRGVVRFTIRELYRTAGFRLAYVDPTSGDQTFSDPAKVAVKSLLTVRLSKDHVMSGRTVTVQGRLKPEAAARPVIVQQRVGGRWRSRGTAYARDTYYALRFEVHRVGYHPIRVIFQGDRANTGARALAPLRVYDPAPATWYGPGFYGNRTACGQTLTTETLGVAHRWLPCGTKVSVLFEGHTIAVPVIDRGPYSHADWDLTQETAERLGFSGTDTIGVVRSS